MCSDPNIKGPCPYRENQAKEIYGYSGVPKFFKTVLCHKPVVEFSAFSYTGSIYLNVLRLLWIDHRAYDLRLDGSTASRPGLRTTLVMILVPLFSPGDDSRSI